MPGSVMCINKLGVAQKYAIQATTTSTAPLSIFRMQHVAGLTPPAVSRYRLLARISHRAAV